MNPSSWRRVLLGRVALAVKERVYVAAQWYSSEPRCGAIYICGWSFHWAQRGPVVVEDGEVRTLRERPWRAIVVYRKVLYAIVDVRLWPLRCYCEHGFRKSAWWHRCDYVTTANPDGRPPDEELWPEDNGDLAAAQAGSPPEEGDGGASGREGEAA